MFVCKRWRDLLLPCLYAVVTVDLWRQPKSFEAFFDFILNKGESYEPMPADRFNVEKCVLLCLSTTHVY